ncbi:ketosteroid isomerase-like protein [Limimaricola soesokkakensis]|uniref:Ketosteroid isomerase-like protein n=1 Tax=Limimaricola soesokkakensis TaxID=1343159 RepID=A0A1X6Z6E5_9RHOB|nr:nuclear transport factor 2 family protein [Limimaricola soesokkakensis]PSK86754.1 ketosteroid isomerase-like protein [Limimaricola soesokkakensis]SLN41791.1 SnoaL-like domain protein [Limimaricola soesokkakensis]
MTLEDLCHRYLDALNTGDLESVRALFVPGAEIVSPLYGVRPAHDFYAELFADTARSETTLLNVFDSSAGGRSVALHFRYVWTLASGKVVEFECVDVFELAEDRQRFTKMTIIYDTAPLRSDFEASRKQT